jgi:hypothetical protein
VSEVSFDLARWPSSHSMTSRYEDWQYKNKTSQYSAHWLHSRNRHKDNKGHRVYETPHQISHAPVRCKRETFLIVVSLLIWSKRAPRKMTWNFFFLAPRKISSFFYCPRSTGFRFRFDFISIFTPRQPCRSQ